MVKRPGLYSLIALVVVGGLAFLFTNLEPRYRLADQVPDKEQAVAASGSIDAKLAGANPIDVLVELPEGETIYDQERPRRHRRHPRRGREPEGRRQRLVGGDAPPLDRREGRPHRCRRARGIRPPSARATSSAASSPRRRTPSSSPGRIPDIDASQLLPGRRGARRVARCDPRRRIPATRSRSPACPRSPPATAR